MEQKPPSLAGPLWVVGIGILILCMGMGFMAYLMREKRYEATYPPTNAQTSLEGARPVTEDVQPALPKLPTGGGVGGDSIQPGSITGRVTLRGTPPPETPVIVTDPNCGKTAPPPTTTRFYVVSSGGGLADVFIYIRTGLEGRTYPVAPTAPIIDQRGCEYSPHILGLQTSQPVIVRNSDKTLHNVHFTPAIEGNGEVNRAQLGGGADLSFLWSKPEVFLRLKCDVHPWMFSYIGVLDHPYFAVSDTNGFFEFPGPPPPGRYVVEAVHRKTHGRGGKGVQREVEVKAGENLQVDFEIALQPTR